MRAINSAVKMFTLFNIIFVLLLSVSGSLGGAVGEVVYYLAFAIPVFACVLISSKLKREREEISGVAESPRGVFSIDAISARTVAMFAFPTIAVVFLISYLTNLLLSLAGAEGSTVADAPLWIMLIDHALVPTLLEEMLFRYVPLILLAPYSKRWCVILSSVFFALIHCNLFQIPYALVAGAIFIVVDLMYDSVLPSIILHLANNVASVIWIKYCTETKASLIYIGVMVLIALVSIIFIFIERNRLLKEVQLCCEKRDNFTTRSPIALIVLTLGIAILNLF